MSPKMLSIPDSSVSALSSQWFIHIGTDFQGLLGQQPLYTVITKSSCLVDLETSAKSTLSLAPGPEQMGFGLSYATSPLP